MANERKRTILLIDDDTSLLVTLGDFFRFKGYHVVTADSGEQGLERLEQATPDLIVLDMSMPGMGGAGFLKEISDAEGKPAYPILVLTARANMAESFADVAVDGFVAKPCSPQDLLMEVDRILFLRSGNGAAAAPEPAAKAKILVGESDPAIRGSIVASLGEAGFLVEGAESGPEVIEKAVMARPDLVIMHLGLQGMSGDAVASVLKEMKNTAGTPIVLYDESGKDEPADAYAGSGAEIRRFVGTNDPAALLGVVKTVLANG